MSCVLPEARAHHKRASAAEPVPVALYGQYSAAARDKTRILAEQLAVILAARLGPT